MGYRQLVDFAILDMMPVQLYTTTDKSIRSILIKDLKEKYRNHDKNKTAIIPELALPRGLARIDVAVVNGVMHGYELKSDFDNLLRLRLQIDAYNLIFDKVTLVVGRKHILEALNAIPNWWGVTVAKEQNNAQDLNLFLIREAEDNPGQDIYTIATMLWKREALELLDKKHIKNQNHCSKEILCKMLVEEYDKDELKEHVRQYLVNRFFNSKWRADEASKRYDD